MIYSFKRDFRHGLLPNSITLFGLLLVPVVLCLLEKWLLCWALAVYVIAWLSDLFDGWVARRLNCSSQIGAFFDPLVDKFFTWTFLIYFWEEISIFVSLPVFAIGLSLTILRVYKWNYGVKKQVDYNIMAKLSGKLKANIEKSAFCLLILLKLAIVNLQIDTETIIIAELFINHVMIASLLFAVFSLAHQIKEIS